MNAPAFDFQNPDYTAVFAERAERLQYIRADKTGETLIALRAHYKNDPAQFIDDWGCTFDPRLIRRKLPAVVPFKLFPKQREWVGWFMDMWDRGDPGLTEKARDAGISWLCVATSSTLCMFHDDLAVGFGSRKEEYVDKSGSPKALFWKAREFIKLTPEEFRPGWSVTDAPHLRINFPHTNSVMTGEAGDNIGRGDRTSFYIVDESAFVERPQLIEASLSQTTDCRIDVSTPNGMANPFAEKIHSWPDDQIFKFDWRDDPRKDDEWYAKQVRDLDPVTIAQEIDRNYAASVKNIVIPGSWVDKCVDAHKTLGLEITGARRAALDVADEGPDLNALCISKGVLVENSTTWSGKGDDIFGTVQTAFGFCDVMGVADLDYDADGLGAGVRGDARVLNEKRKHAIETKPFRGSGGVVDKNKPIENGAPRNEKKDPNEVVRTNGDYFLNAKAQAWFSLRFRFMRTVRALEMHAAGEDWEAAYHPDDLISLSSGMPEIAKVKSELSQAQFKMSVAGKMMIDKAPEGMRSPNRADSVMIAFAPSSRKARYNLGAWST